MKRPRLKPQFPIAEWTTDQDCFLIEHSSLPIEELSKLLLFTEEEIKLRKEILGLFRRQRQMMKGVV